MSLARRWGTVLGMAFWMGCGGSVEVPSGGGGAGGSGGMGGSTSTVTATTASSGTTTSETARLTSTQEDGCPGLPADAVWVDVQLAGSSYHLTSACPYYGEPYGPAGYAWTNGKSGPEWYFTISACEEGIPEGSQKGPSLLVVASVP